MTGLRVLVLAHNSVANHLRTGGEGSGNSRYAGASSDTNSSGYSFLGWEPTVHHESSQRLRITSGFHAPQSLGTSWI